MSELQTKLTAVRDAMRAHDLTAVRLRGLDWFSWATCGGSAAVLLAAETGVAEALVTMEGAWVLTDEIEAARLEAEEVPVGMEVWAAPWAERGRRESFVRDAAGGGKTASDRPTGEERPLPAEVHWRRSSLLPEELDRYRALGSDAAVSMSEVLAEATPDWTGFELAGCGAEALWSRGIHPALTLVGDERRLPIYRHATASRDRLGSRAMLVFCARRHGLFANLTRFVYFREPSADERRLARDAALVEAAALDASRPGATLGEVFSRIVDAYAAVGHAGAERFHHQGGSCGYGARDAIAVPGSEVVIQPNNAMAWNPSLPGAKIEDTVVMNDEGPEILTVDAAWPTVEVAGRARPDVLVR